MPKIIPNPGRRLPIPKEPRARMSPAVLEGLGLEPVQGTDRPTWKLGELTVVYVRAGSVFHMEWYFAGVKIGPHNTPRAVRDLCKHLGLPVSYKLV